MFCKKILKSEAVSIIRIYLWKVRNPKYREVKTVGPSHTASVAWFGSAIRFVSLDSVLSTPHYIGMEGILT